ncbi:unnamed protein product, partial [Chrysoparadoxa australica]
GASKTPSIKPSFSSSPPPQKMGAWADKNAKVGEGGVSPSPQDATDRGGGAATARKKESCLSLVSGTFEGRVQRFFKCLGSLVARRPRSTLALSLVAVL